MINFDDDTKENIKKHNPNWLRLPDHPYRILVTGGSLTEKNSLLILTSPQPDVDKLI